ncbi:MAG: type I DNA topoisomerase, partial [Patescibacteria group bacterium]
VRDLPQKEMGIDIENNFEPKYEVSEKAQKQVSKLKKLASTSDKILFAPDEDREGEAIAWHLKAILKPKNSERITFHEITKSAIESALKNPRQIDLHLVDAQQARRVLDRLVGYELSPFLWKKVAKGLSAGRVQSVAVRLIADREREIEKFKAEEYWTIEAIFNTDKQIKFEAKLNALNGKILKKFDLNNTKQATELADELKTGNYKIASVESKESKKKVPEPFRTSTLQQDANNKLHFSSKQTMMIAQQLYEGVDLGGKGQVGLITYMRTDSLNLANEFLTSCHDYIKKNIGEEYAPKTVRRFKTTSKGAQEAHEAIRPTHANFSPDEIKQYLDDKQFKLYQLIWSRTVAGQMNEAIIASKTVDIVDNKNHATFRANGQTIKFDGFLKIYSTETKETLLPDLNVGETVELEEIKPTQHFTEPPARYTEATLIKAMEEYGIGRPSTYAPTIATIQERNYVTKEDKKLKPTAMGLVVNDILVEHFPAIVDYKFTAKMEEDLDAIAAGEKEWQPIIKEFYFPFHKNLEEKNKTLTKKELTEKATDEICEKCGKPMVIKTGRFGRFLACTGYPECKNTRPVSGDDGKPQELELTEEKCPDCGAPLAKRRGRYGAFLGCSKYPDCKYIKKFSQPTGVICPQCNIGEIVSRKGRGKKVFYACNNYPKCKFILWGKPTGAHCEVCKSLMVEKGETAVCGNEKCSTNAKESTKP